MALNTEHKVTLTESQISVILNSLDHTLDRWQQNGYHCEEDQQIIDSVYENLEGTIDKYYDKVEKAKSKQPVAEWQDTYISVIANVDLPTISIIICTYTTKNMTFDPEYYYAVQTFLEDDELYKIWNIIEIAMNRAGYDVSNAELSMRLYDNELEDNIEYDMEISQ